MRYLIALLALLGLAVLMLALMAGLYGLTNDNPCNTFFHQRTGSVEYEGRTFKCWHGEIAGITE